jgi:hypothetical protein
MGVASCHPVWWICESVKSLKIISQSILVLHKVATATHYSLLTVNSQLQPIFTPAPAALLYW